MRQGRDLAGRDGRDGTVTRAAPGARMAPPGEMAERLKALPC